MSKYFTVTDIDNHLNINIDFEIQNRAWQDLADLERSLIKISKRVFVKLGLSKSVTNVEFSIILTDNNAIKKINQQYRQKDKGTNTLSFPAQDIVVGQLDNLQIEDGFLFLGDIIFAYDVIKAESARDNKTFHDHFAHLLIHGLLHLFGYDHQNDQEALEMENLEIEILKDFNIKSPYE